MATNRMYCTNIWFVILVGLMSESLTDACSTVFKQFTGLRRKGLKLPLEHALKNLEGVDLIACTSECARTENCRTVSWSSTNRGCRLGSIDVRTDNTTFLKLVDDVNWDAWSLKELTGLTCRDVRQVNPGARSGFYRNRLNMTIYCDFVTGGGDWLVFQRRLDGSLDFYQTWEKYKTGFGDLCGEFWLGLENVYRILRASPATHFQLRIDLEDWDGHMTYASYSFFDLGDEDDGYRLNVSTTASGPAGDSLNKNPKNNGRMFTTYDRDNDLSGENCAVNHHGAWWYSACHASNLNGRYYIGGHTTNYASGVTWRTLKGQYYSFRRTEMKMSELS